MITLCIAAFSRYVMALKEAKKLRENEAANNKRKIIADQIDSVKRKRMEVDTCIQSLNKNMKDLP